MKIFSKQVVCGIVAVLCVAIFAMGCQTYGGSAGVGAATGAGLGAIIGNQSGHAGQGALIGGVLGAMTGLIVHDIKVRQVKSAQETAQQYQYQPSQGIKLYPGTSGVTPMTVKPGQSVKATTEYAVLGAAPGQINVQEQRLLEKDGKQLKQLTQDVKPRSDGTWVSEVTFDVPANAAPGTYQIVHNITIPDKGTSTATTMAFNVQP